MFLIMVPIGIIWFYYPVYRSVQRMAKVLPFAKKKGR